MELSHSKTKLKDEIFAVVRGDAPPLRVEDIECDPDEPSGDEWETRKAVIWDWLHTQKDLAFAIASVEPVKGWWGGRPMERHELSALLRRNGISTEFSPDEILRAFREGCPHLKPKL